MQLFQNILVTADASGESVKMVKSLLALPISGRASVTLLYVISNASQFAGVTAEDKKADGRALLQKARDTLAASTDVALSERLEEGDPKTTVLRVADEINASLIVMGGRSMNRLVAILRNSVSQYVFQLSTRPLLLIRDGLTATNISRVMVAIDGSEASDQALALATNLLRDVSGAEILLARVQKGLEAASNKPAIANPEKDDPVVAAAIAKVKQAKLPYRLYFSVGDPGREIALLSGESGADLLVMGSPDRRPTIAKTLPDLERLLGKSVSDYVRVQAQCPVLMTRPSA